MAEAPLITTVIPTYQRPQLLARAIKSVLRQSYPHIQVCVYDNASGDETAAVVAEIVRGDARVKYHCHERNIGLGANFTYAMKAVSTPYFSILSDDDYHLPNFFTTVMQGFSRHPDAMFSAGSVVSMTEAGQITHVSMDGWARDGYFPAPGGLFEWTIPKHPDITGLLFRSEVIEHVGLLDPALLNADYDFEWRIASRFPYVVSKVPCVVSTVHEHQATRTSDADAWLQSYHTMRGHLSTNSTLSADVRARAQALLAGTFADALRVIGLAALRDRNFPLARAVAEALGGEFDRRRDERLLAALTTACERVPPVQLCLRGAYALVLGSRRRRSRETKQLVDRARAAEA
jgi:GT2 family glycosyltransferase